jgi:CRP-like cAMP-binding protein
MTTLGQQIVIHPPFDPQHFLSRPGPGRIVNDYRKNQAIFRQGARAETVFHVLRGRVKLTVMSEHGKEAVVGLLEPGQFFGEACLNDHPLRTATATAMQDCKIASVSKSIMLATLRDEPAFSEFFMAYLLSRSTRIEEDLIDQLFNSSEKRLARLLLILAGIDEDGESSAIDIDISQETLAEMIGTTRSRVSHFMNKFRKAGFISYDGRILVHATLLDAALSDKSQMPSG